MKINFEAVKEVGKGILGCTALVACTIASMACDLSNDSDEKGNKSKEAIGYADVIAEILKTDMPSYRKDEIISIIPMNASAEVYKVVINVVNSDEPSYRKISIINTLFEKMKESE